ncbi:hypothetical protein Tco_0896372 [Tanacetum coccineum]
MANLPPNHNEFAPAAEAAPNNMNGWGADPLYPPPPASDSESEIEFEEAEAEAEAEVAPIPPSVPANPEPETVTVVTGRLTPLKRLFTDTQVWIGSSSSSTAASHDPEDLTLSHIRSDLDALHRRVRHIEEDDVCAENKRLRMMLDYSENRTRAAWRELDLIHEDPRDPYIAARDAATTPAIDNDDSPTHEETLPSELQGSPPRDS